LSVSFQPVEGASYDSAFRLEAVKSIEDNPFLESLAIETKESGINFEEFLDLISALQRNTTLRSLGFRFYHASLSSTDDVMDHQNLDLTNDEVNQLVPILMKKYGLEHLPDLSCADDRAVKAVMRLNGAGCRSLIKDGSSISKGVDVLSAVSDDINCVFLHLLENPGLCNRRAVETTTRSKRPGANLDESSSSGKRERAQSQLGKEPPRRRLA
jgi:hypothetical protein